MKKLRDFGERMLLRADEALGSLEVGWLSVAHNLLKKAAIDRKTKSVGTGITPYTNTFSFYILFLKKMSCP